jgi:hypothetical protein
MLAIYAVASHQALLLLYNVDDAPTARAATHRQALAWC